MKIIVTTSDKYLHLLPIFTYCFNKYMPGNEVTVLGYKEPEPLPENFSFVSMGKQGSVNEWSTDIRQWIEAQDEDLFMWLFEDSFIRGFDEYQLYTCMALTCMPDVGRVALTKDILNRPHKITEGGIVWADANSRYRLSTQPSIWRKEFLLQYLHYGLSPWDFETQDPVNDEWIIAGTETPAIIHNEGVRKSDIFELDLNGFNEEDISNIKQLSSWLSIT